MAYYRRKKTYYKKKPTYKKKAYYKKKKFYKKKATIRRPLPHGPPDSYLVKLKYVQHIDLGTGWNAGTDSYGQFNFRANSIFDPDYAAGGSHQPMFADQICAMGFDTYCVRSAVIKVCPTYETGGNFKPCAYGIMLDEDTIPAPTLETDYVYDAFKEYTERNKGSNVSAIYGVVGQPAYLSKKCLTMKYDAVKFNRVSKFSEVYSDDNNLGSCNATGPTTNTANNVLFNIWACQVGDVEKETSYPTLVEIWYTVLFQRKKTVRIIQS